MGRISNPRGPWALSVQRPNGGGGGGVAFAIQPEPATDAGGGGGGGAIAIQPGPTTDVHGHGGEKKYIDYIQSQRAPLGSRAPGQMPRLPIW